MLLKSCHYTSMELPFNIFKHWKEIHFRKVICCFVSYFLIFTCYVWLCWTRDMSGVVSNCWLDCKPTRTTNQERPSMLPKNLLETKNIKCGFRGEWKEAGAFRTNDDSFRERCWWVIFSIAYSKSRHHNILSVIMGYKVFCFS